MMKFDRAGYLQTISHMRLDSGNTLRDLRDSLGLSQAKLAEASGIPQYILSGFELGKNELADAHQQALLAVLRNSEGLRAIVARKKRYREHTYVEVKHDSKRVARHAPSNGNEAYLSALKMLETKPKRYSHRAISLFSGCGGFTLGFASAGFEIRGFLEKEKDLQVIYQKNFPEAVKIGGDIAAVPTSDIEDIKRSTGEVEVIIGGPPCQGFSLAGKRDVNDPRNALFRHYLRFVDVYRPKVAILENVRLLTSMRSPDGNYVKNQIRSEFGDHGYSARMFEINAKNFGVPQHRERVFFIAVREDINKAPSFPTASHGEEVGLFSEKLPCLTFADACSDLAYIESGEGSGDPLHVSVSHPKHVIDWLWDVKEGFSAHDNADPAKRPPSGYNTTYKRQIWREPASTVQTTFGMISGCRNVHPIATRSLTIREAARIQSFPDSFRFEGSAGTIRTGIGNAVPPLLARVVAQHLIAEFL
ncbi:DNA (cytosine-5-)-methyltransferase [Methylocystis sp. Sn-Cys]|uniref:DNA (cytosine-5-)-methyltransferase n=1 Tax=Methylocystis sp. Sn-Cys TaxID=1701263 RepID=UPI00192499F2|nr:DNA (cytosine-5-)-methyltransferase [Methylocystis sp. Sn-Cys]MBL1256041.1 DNA (cytosine-5-)-methyltransferase [Methylocystis sp. Sn-Cys]